MTAISTDADVTDRVKRFVARLLTSTVVGRIVDLAFRNRIPHRGTRISLPRGSEYSREAAALLFRLFESAECRFVEKYIKAGGDVLELGGNVGGVGSLIASKLSDGDRLFVCEPNPDVIDYLTHNLGVNSGGCSIVVENCAVGYEDGEVGFFRDEHGSRSSHISPGGDLRIASRSVRSLVAEHRLTRFTLVADIEGAELCILLDPHALEKCDLLVAEFHEVDASSLGLVGVNRSFDVEQQIELLVELHGFSVVERRGPVVVARKAVVG